MATLFINKTFIYCERKELHCVFCNSLATVTFRSFWFSNQEMNNSRKFQPYENTTNMYSTKSQKKRKARAQQKSAPLATPKKRGYNAGTGHGNSDIGSASPITPVELMTSRDFQFDIKAHVETLDQLMTDKVRIQNFKAAIIHNKHLFKGKCVLDVGCGVGILSLFAAAAGAAKVYAVDSSNAIYYTRKIVKDNGYDTIIEVLKGEIDEVDVPVKEVDIIISDWMGYSLLHESKCRSVIYARDKWLKKSDGLIFPDQGKLFIVAFENGKLKSESIDWWRNVYGFDMRCIREDTLKEPRQELLKPQQVISEEYPIKLIDLHVATIEDLGFRSEYMLDIQKCGRMDGIALYFHVYFTKSHTPLYFSTDPWSACTNWMQTIFFFDQSEAVQDKELYHGHIEFCPTNASGYDLNDIIVNFDIENGNPEKLDFGMHMSWRLRSASMASVETSCTGSPDKNENVCIDNISRVENVHVMTIRDILALPSVEPNCARNLDRNGKFCIDKMESSHLRRIRNIISLRSAGNLDKNGKFCIDKINPSVESLRLRRIRNILAFSSVEPSTENADKKANDCIDDLIPSVENLNLSNKNISTMVSVEPSCAENVDRNANWCIDGTLPSVKKKQNLNNSDILNNRCNLRKNQKSSHDSIQIGDNMYSIRRNRRGIKKQNKMANDYK